MMPKCSWHRQVDEDELEMGERELYEVQLTDKSSPWASCFAPRMQRVTTHRLTSPTATFES